MLLDFQKVGLSCRETAFSLGASQAFSDGMATGTFETRFGAIVNTAFKFARFCTHNITEQVLGNALSLTFFSLSLSHSLTLYRFTTIIYIRRRGDLALL